MSDSSLRGDCLYSAPSCLPLYECPLVPFRFGGHGYHGELCPAIMFEAWGVQHSPQGLPFGWVCSRHFGHISILFGDRSHFRLLSCESSALSCFAKSSASLGRSRLQRRTQTGVPYLARQGMSWHDLQSIQLMVFCKGTPEFIPTFPTEHQQVGTTRNLWTCVALALRKAPMPNFREMGSSSNS